MSSAPFLHFILTTELQFLSSRRFPRKNILGGGYPRSNVERGIKGFVCLGGSIQGGILGLPVERDQRGVCLSGRGIPGYPRSKVREGSTRGLRGGIRGGGYPRGDPRGMVSRFIVEGYPTVPQGVPTLFYKFGDCDQYFSDNLIISVVHWKNLNIIFHLQSCF